MRIELDWIYNVVKFQKKDYNIQLFGIKLFRGSSMNLISPSFSLKTMEPSRE